MKGFCKKHGEVELLINKKGWKRCGKCSGDYVTRHRIEKKKKLVALFGGKCQKCGYDKYIGALDFHHRNPLEKKFSLSVRGLCYSWDTLLEEAKKCDILCANCHREIENGIL